MTSNETVSGRRAFPWPSDRPWVRAASVAALACAAAVAILVAPRAKLNPFYFKASYRSLDLPWYLGLGLRAALLICALAILASCFTLSIVLCLPQTRTVFKWLLEPRLTWLYRRPPK
ncbi:hypothetical protein ACWDRB_65375 [Nonomuraea sp. NPDC003707]